MDGVSAYIRERSDEEIRDILDQIFAERRPTYRRWQRDGRKPR